MWSARDTVEQRNVESVEDVECEEEERSHVQFAVTCGTASMRKRLQKCERSAALSRCEGP